MVFGRWDFLKEQQIPVYMIQVFGSFRKIHAPLMVIMRMIEEASNKNDDQNSISDDFSIWFYITLRKLSPGSFQFEKLEKDKELVDWLEKNFEHYLDGLVCEINQTQKLMRRLPTLTDWPKYQITPFNMN